MWAMCATVPFECGEPLAHDTVSRCEFGALAARRSSAVPPCIQWAAIVAEIGDTYQLVRCSASSMRFMKARRQHEIADAQPWRHGLGEAGDAHALGASAASGDGRRGRQQAADILFHDQRVVTSGD